MTGCHDRPGERRQALGGLGYKGTCLGGKSTGLGFRGNDVPPQERVKKRRRVHAMGYYSAVKRMKRRRLQKRLQDLEPVPHNEVRQKERSECRICMPTYGI